MQTAIEHHQAGRRATAEAMYRQILSQEPTNAAALHLLGILAHQDGHPDEAIRLINEAIAISPDRAAYHSG